MLFCVLDGGNDARQRNYGRRGGNCIGRGGLESDFVRVWGGMRRVSEITGAAVGTALAVVG